MIGTGVRCISVARLSTRGPDRRFYFVPVLSSNFEEAPYPPLPTDEGRLPLSDAVRRYRKCSQLSRHEADRDPPGCMSPDWSN